MSDLGQFKAGESVLVVVAFNNDAGSAEDPTTPYLNHIAPDGTLTALSAPVKQSSKTGLYGLTVDTTGYASGIHYFHIGGTVTTAKTPHTAHTCRIIANTEADVMARLGTPTGASVVVDIATRANQASVNAIPTTPLLAASYTAPDNAGIAAIRTDYTAVRAAKLDNLDAAVTSRSTLTASGVWDALLTGIATVGSVGKLVKDYLDTAISSRMVTFSYTAPDNTSITAIKAKTDNIPTIPATEANVTAVGSAVTVVDGNVDAIKLKTDLLPADPASNTQVNTRLATIGYTAPDNANVGLIKAKTDLIPASPAAVSNIPTALQIATQVDATLATAHGSGTWGVTAPSGQVAFTYALTRSDNGLPIAGATVWMTSDIAGNSLVGSGVTNATGNVMFFLTPATYYVWRQHPDYSFVNPDTEIVA